MDLVSRTRGLLDRASAWLKEKLLPWAGKNPGQAAGVAAVGACASLLWIGGSVLVNGLIAGVLVSAAIGILVWKARKIAPWLYDTIIKYPLASDVVISIIAFAVAPGGITGWVSASVAALLASVWLFSAQKTDTTPTLVEADVVSVT